MTNPVPEVLPTTVWTNLIYHSPIISEISAAIPPPPLFSPYCTNTNILNLVHLQCVFLLWQGEVAAGLRIEFNILPELAGIVIGKKGENIKRVYDETGVTKIDVNEGVVRLIGPSIQAVTKAREMLEFQQVGSHTHTYIYIYTHTWYIFTCTYIYTHICYIFTYTNIHLHTYMPYIHIHIHTWYESLVFIPHISNLKIK